MRPQVWNTIDVEYGTFNWLRREVALKIGHHADHNLLGRTERAHVDSIIESGVMQFIQAAYPEAPMLPEPPAGEGREPDADHVEAEKEAKRRPPHRWSFIHRIHEITTESGKSEYELPPDFGGVIGEPTTTREGGRIGIVRETHIRQLISADGESAKPRYCALRRSSIGGAKVQTTDLLLYPIPDAIEKIKVEYTANPPTLDDGNQYPPGGREHAETVLAYCFYVLSQRTTDADVAGAVRLVQERLVASIVLDRASAKPTSDGIWVEDDGRFNVAYLSRMIGRHIGAGPNPKAWTHQQEQLIAEIIRRARRRVYSPPILPGESYPHDWTFLRPVAQMNTESGKHTYDLPADFVQFYGPMTYGINGTVLYTPVKIVGEMSIRQLLQRQEASSRPDRGAVRVKDGTDDVGTRYELLLWPVPDDNYELNYRYRVNPDTSLPNSLPALVDKLDLHGGDRYSEMYLEAAMLTADEMSGKARSPHMERFIRAVHSAVGQDRLTYAADYLGYNGDPSAEVGHEYGDYDWHEWDENVVTYNGITY